MVLLDAFSTEDGEMVGTVEMLDPLVMFVAKQTLYTIFVFKVDVPENVIPFHDLVQNVEVKGQLIHAFNLLHEFAADWAAHSEVVVQHGETLSAECVPAMDQDPWNLFTDIKLLATIIAKVEAPSLVVGLQQILWL